jgi:hypothetical protein
MGQTALLPLRRKECCGFFRPKNPTASGGFEPAILGIRDARGSEMCVGSVSYEMCVGGVSDIEVLMG